MKILRYFGAWGRPQQSPAHDGARPVQTPPEAGPVYPAGEKARDLNLCQVKGTGAGSFKTYLGAGPAVGGGRPRQQNLEKFCFSFIAMFNLSS